MLFLKKDYLRNFYQDCSSSSIWRGIWLQLFWQLWSSKGNFHLLKLRLKLAKISKLKEVCIASFWRSSRFKTVVLCVGGIWWVEREFYLLLQFAVVQQIKNMYLFGRFSLSLLYPFLTAVVWPLKCLKVLSRRIFIYLSHSSFCSNPILIYFLF